ncbi:MAG: peptidoglycan D,D-transpeptidase FtsI family protein [Aquificaceae bacterium]
MQEFRKENSKILLVSFFVFLGILVVFLKMVYIQLIGREEYIQKIIERSPKLALVEIPTYRGSIKDRKGNDLAISIPTVSIFAFPKYVQNKEDLARRLSAALNLSEQDILKRLSTERKFVWLAKRINKELSPYIRSVIRDTQNTRAVGVQEDFSRFYPNGHLASNLLGFVGDDGRGLEGLEYLLNPFFYEEKTKVKYFLSPDLGRIALEPVEDTFLSKDVYTTIDLGVQTILEDIRDKVVNTWKPKKVSIIIMDVRNGDILGLTTYPYYDPNEYKSYPPWVRRNYAITDLFEPGSVMKPFFIGKALDKGYINENYGVDCGRGKVEVYGRFIRDVHPYGYLSVDQVLIKSSNVGTVKIAKFLSKKDVEDIMKKVHFYDAFKIIPGEVRPRLPDYNYPANILYSAIGQGLSTNLLNLCAAFGSLATGQLVKPRVVLYFVDNEGKKSYSQVDVLNTRLFSPSVMNWLHKNLVGVVEKGTAKAARSEYFTIAGKTGTSQKFDLRMGKYSKEKVVAYFVGYFPATQPKFVAGISVDEPKGIAYGGSAAAPYFKELAERIAAYYRLEPDKLKKSIPSLSGKE